MASDFKILENEQLKLEISDEPDVITVKWLGKSIERDPAKFLNPVLKEIFETANSGRKSILMDFRNLEYMNSSTITPIVKILAETGRDVVKVSIIYSKMLRWQDISFSALKIFKVKDSRVEVRGE